MSLAQVHVECYQAFKALCEASSQSEAYHRDILEEFDKYCLWAGNVGAAASKYRLSLDYRLREASFYKAQVSKLLTTLHRQVEKARQILAGERIPFEKLSSDSEPDNDRPQPEQNTDEDSPWELSSDSSDDLGLPSSLPPAAEENTSPESILFASDPHLSGTTELQQLTSSIRLGVTCLYKLPLRTPAPIDRLNDRSVEELSCYEHFDILYVRDKFRDTRLCDDVKIRLGKMITRRRQLLLYRRSHRENLQTDTLPAVPAATGTTPMGMGQTSDREGRAGPEVRSQAGSDGRTLRSKATTFDIAQMPSLNLANLLGAPSIAPSDADESVAASEATRDIHIQVPRPPKNLENETGTQFECKYCYIPVFIRSDRAWKHHVLSDLQPYVCTFSQCDLADHAFKDRNAWFSHEMKHHRGNFFCNTAGHPAFKAQSEFEKHMKESHEVKLGDHSITSDVFWRTPSALHREGTGNLSSDDLCNLCFRPTRNMKGHVGRHLQQIALFAIPRGDFSVDDDLLSDTDSDAPQKVSKKSVVQTDGDTSQVSEKPTEELSSQPLEINAPVSQEDQYADVEDISEPPDVPSTDATVWDQFTTKFSLARDEKSELSPIPFIPVQDKTETHATPAPNPLSTPNESKSKDINANKGLMWLETMTKFANNVHKLNQHGHPEFGDKFPETYPRQHEIPKELTKGITIALIDDGIDLIYEPIYQNVMGGKSFASGYSDSNIVGAPEPPYYASTTGHGTDMARHITQFCPSVKIFVCKLDMLGGGDGGKLNFTAKSAADAVAYATQHGCDIISLSWTIVKETGKKGNNNVKDLDRLTKALEEAAKKNILIFCSSPDVGVAMEEDKWYPFDCNIQNMFRIGAAQADGTKLEMAGDRVDFILPGVNVLHQESDRVVPGVDDHPRTGSSIATALAAGLAALMIHCVKMAALLNILKGNPHAGVGADTLKAIKQFDVMKQAFQRFEGQADPTSNGKLISINSFSMNPTDTASDGSSAGSKWEDMEKVARELVPWSVEEAALYK